MFGFENKEPLVGKAISKEDRRMAAEIRKRWSKVIDLGDPYYNPNLSMIKTDFSIGY